MKKLDVSKINALVDLAVNEDFGGGDPTSAITVPDDAVARASIITREEIVVCGMPVVEAVLARYDEGLKLKILKSDGSRANVADKLGVIEGPLRPMLSAERVILNFLQRLCGIATMTHKYVLAIRGTKSKIYDTRKTMPGWRYLEKYAVRCGGGYNHRHNLSEAIMIKDNHLVQISKNLRGELEKLVKQGRSIKGVKFVCVEVDHVDDQLDVVLQVPGVDVILLDNMGQW